MPLTGSWEGKKPEQLTPTGQRDVLYYVAPYWIIQLGDLSEELPLLWLWLGICQQVVSNCILHHWFSLFLLLLIFPSFLSYSLPQQWVLPFSNPILSFRDNSPFISDYNIIVLTRCGQILHHLNNLCPMLDAERTVVVMPFWIILVTVKMSAM